jgi:predicted DNA-binding protein (UPF0251 family)
VGEIPVAVEAELARLRAENVRLLKLLRLSPQQAAPPGPAQGAFFEAAYRVMVEVVEAMREGKVITLVPRTQRLTTQEAADFLGVSRPTLVKLLGRSLLGPDRHA